jgi:4a-hydroxytetrahydrobiopterin dehydratase
MSQTTLLCDNEIQACLMQLPTWRRSGQAIEKLHQFKNFHDTMAFVNALAWVAHTHDHHPELKVSHGQCHVSFTTHSVGGLSASDFACAAKIDALLAAVP